jgi:hypothetical protein
MDNDLSMADKAECSSRMIRKLLCDMVKLLSDGLHHADRMKSHL